MENNISRNEGNVFYHKPAYNHLQSSNEEGGQAFQSKCERNEMETQTAIIDLRVMTLSRKK